MLRIVQIDSFSSSPFSGNPAVVVEPGEPLDSSLMQLIAREMNVSETAFLVEQGDHYDLRWFTPTAEVDLCGHATLAAAHALWTEWGEPGRTIRFKTLSGELVATRSGRLTWLDFPSERIESLDLATPAGFEELFGALDIEPVNLGENRMDLLVEVESEAAVRELDPDFDAIGRLSRQRGNRGLIVSAPAEAGAGYDFVSRFFAPALGIDEDPVTGSAHCALAPYWSDRLGQDELLGYQMSDRGGYVHVRVVGDRVHLGGEAVTVFAGEMRVTG